MALGRRINPYPRWGSILHFEKFSSPMWGCGLDSVPKWAQGKIFPHSRLPVREKFSIARLGGKTHPHSYL